MYPHERSLVQRLQNKPFALIGVNSDAKQRVQDAIQRENITWRSFWDGGSTGGPIARAWSVHGWPTIYVIDHRGVIRYRNVRGEAMDAAVDELIEKAMAGFAEDLASPKPAVRGLAAFRSGRYQFPEAKAKLSALLDDADPSVRWRAAAGLALMEKPAEALRPLLRQAMEDSKFEVRLAAFDALGKAGDPQVGPIAIKALQDPNTTLRRSAVTVLGNLKLAAAVAELTTATRDSDAQTAKGAAHALAQIGSPDSLLALKTQADQADHPGRVWLAVALHRAGQEGTAERFAQLLKADEVRVRRQAVAALGELSGLPTLDLLIAALEDSDREVRKLAAGWLRQSPDPRAAEALKKSLAHRIDELLEQLAGADFRQRQSALAELRQLDPAAAPLLFARLDQASVQVRYELASVIGNLGNEEVVGLAAAKLRQADLDQMTRYVYESVLRPSVPKARTLVHELTRHEQPAVRESGVRLLFQDQDDESRKLLQQALQDPAATVKAYAAYALSQSQDLASLDVLKQMLKEPDVRTRSLAVMGIANYGAPTALPILTKMPADADASLLQIVAGALSRFPDKEATTALLELGKKDKELRQQVMFQLQRQDTPDAARALGEFLMDEDAQLRERARSLLGRMRTPEARQLLENAKTLEKPEDPKQP